MNIEEFRAYCLSKPLAEEDMPFGNSTLVFKVYGKMFALCGLDSAVLQVNLKCDPALAEDLRERYPAVQPGYHMSKKHWNTVTYDGSVPEMEFREMIDHSYSLVMQKLPAEKRKAIAKIKNT